MEEQRRKIRKERCKERVGTCAVRIMFVSHTVLSSEFAHASGDCTVLLEKHCSKQAFVKRKHSLSPEVLLKIHWGLFYKPTLTLCFYVLTFFLKGAICFL